MAKKKTIVTEGAIPAGDGWDWFVEAAKRAQDATAERTEMDNRELELAFARVFNSPDGQLVLAHFQDWNDKVKDFDPDLGFHNGAAYGFWRSGQRSIVQYIKTMRERGTGK
jgi:hypothetical protein